MIEAIGLTKRYGDKVAVDDLSSPCVPASSPASSARTAPASRRRCGMLSGWTARPPGRAGQRPALRRASRAAARGRRAARGPGDPHRPLGPQPPARPGGHDGIPRRRVDEVIDLVGLATSPSKRVGGFSLGMGQRLGIACALLGDPHTLILDEPVNGLDPDGILWIRNLLKRLAAEGRTVFVSSHLMSEMALTAAHLIVVGQRPAHRRHRASRIHPPRVPRPGPRPLRRGGRLRDLLRRRRGHRQPRRATMSWRLPASTSAAIGRSRADAGIALIELTPQRASLEDAFMEITRDAVEFRDPPRPAASA